MENFATSLAIFVLDVDTTNQADRVGIVRRSGASLSGRCARRKLTTHPTTSWLPLSTAVLDLHSAHCAIDSMVEECLYINRTPQDTVAPGVANFTESQRPGGELAILAVAGKGVRTDFDMT